MKTRKKEEKFLAEEFDRGYVACIGNQIRLWKDHKLTRDLLHSQNITVAKMRKIGIDEEEIQMIKPYLK